ncbi:integrase [Bradyrhizobium sp. CCBAU 51627]|nr:integrase [Bradyrhizobium sp. CCBAU 51627]
MLSDSACKNAKPKGQPYRLVDGGGLYLFVTPAGSKIWRYRYRLGAKDTFFTVGHYPTVSLSDARTARDEARDAKRQGQDPTERRKRDAVKAARASTDTFERIARDWHALNKERWSPRHASDVIGSLDRVFSAIGALPVTAIEPPHVIEALRPIEATARETAHRTRQRISEVFQYAIACGKCVNDPAATVKRALAPIKRGKQPAVTDLGEARAMLRKAEAEPAHAVTKLALRLLALTALRPGTLITTPWDELRAAKDNVWRISAVRMKLTKDRKYDDANDHLVPLSTQAQDVIKALHSITGSGQLAFPNTRHVHKPMSENAIGYLLNRAGYHHKHVPHGWRSTFSSVMNERFRADHAVIELMLAHKPENAVKAAYDRALHLQRRMELAQIWADLILEGAEPAKTLLEGPRR